MIQFPRTDNRLFLHKRLLKRGDVIHTVDEQPVAIDHKNALCRIALLQASIRHGFHEKGGNTATCRTCAQYDDTLLNERYLGNVYCR